MSKTCFVIMPIGTQKYGDTEITSKQFREKYDNLISQAINNARKDLKVTRADDILAPGMITTDILTQLMHSDYVVADITYPNPNVFYELGIRHACRSGTILIREKGKTPIPFDISNLRCIEYEDSTSGLKDLSETIGEYFKQLDAHPEYLDNQFLNVASLTKYEFLKFQDEEKIQKDKNDSFINATLKLIENPKLLSILSDKTLSDEQRNARMFKELSKSPDTAETLFRFLVESGNFKL